MRTTEAGGGSFAAGLDRAFVAAGVVTLAAPRAPDCGWRGPRAESPQPQPIAAVTDAPST
ncbi:MAG TPA: hypothetical protein VGN37_26540 [Actinocatenispora sp.]